MTEAGEAAEGTAALRDDAFTAAASALNERIRE